MPYAGQLGSLFPDETGEDWGFEEGDPGTEDLSLSPDAPLDEDDQLIQKAMKSKRILDTLMANPQFAGPPAPAVELPRMTTPTDPSAGETPLRRNIGKGLDMAAVVASVMQRRKERKNYERYRRAGGREPMNPMTPLAQPSISMARRRRQQEFEKERGEAERVNVGISAREAEMNEKRRGERGATYRSILPSLFGASMREPADRRSDAEKRVDALKKQPGFLEKSEREQQAAINRILVGAEGRAPESAYQAETGRIKARREGGIIPKAGMSDEDFYTQRLSYWMNQGPYGGGLSDPTQASQRAMGEVQARKGAIGEMAARRGSKPAAWADREAVAADEEEPGTEGGGQYSTPMRVQQAASAQLHPNLLEALALYVEEANSGADATDMRQKFEARFGIDPEQYIEPDEQ